MEPRKQHIVPKSYLKKFSISGKPDTVYCVKIKQQYPNVSIKSSHVSSICYIKDFYTIETQELLDQYSIDDKYFIEKQAFLYENELNGYIEKIRLKKQLNSVEAEKFIGIILNIKKRNLAMASIYFKESIINESLDKQFFKLRNSAYRYKDKFKEIGVDIENVINNTELIAKERYKCQSYRQDLYREGFLEELFKGQANRNLIKHLSNQKFYVFTTTQDYPFITNDNPGSTLTKEEVVVNTGFGNWAAFSFPLSPEMLFMVMEGNFDFHAYGIIKNIHFRKVDAVFVDFANKACVFNANEMIIANNIGMLQDMMARYRHIFYPDEKQMQSN